jgi:3-hydroxybutyryl-CoA dehydrogenase
MKIFVRGEKIRTSELKNRLANVSCEWTIIDDTNLSNFDLQLFDIIFDLDFDEHPAQLKYYAGLKNKPVFLSAVKIQLAAATYEYGRKPECLLFGLNALPGFINRTTAEVSLYQRENESALKATMAALSLEYYLVTDRVGMVTPRILFMIINEACYTLQEGTASVADIDTAMKLGTNYPFGPLEWADKIGIKHVYETLEALYLDTREERYKICSLLKTKYLKGESFYS